MYLKKAVLAHSSKGSQLRSAPSLRLSVCNNKDWGRLLTSYARELNKERTGLPTAPL